MADLSDLTALKRKTEELRQDVDTASGAFGQELHDRGHDASFAVVCRIA